ncbi:tetratricopeptide repeat protein [Candidatus Electronema sp. JC]|uniref:tetratricopeptide repeat protein n=1 Tax=Candidatus Electronema sp. JC TaxID=3401570 RepID=UPI003B433FBA
MPKKGKAVLLSPSFFVRGAFLCNDNDMYKDKDYLYQAGDNYFPFIFFLLAVIIYVSYSNTFKVEWQLDDIPNIVTNRKLQVTELTLQQLNRTLHAHPVPGNENKLYRPLPCLTFGLNWYIGQDNVFGYHVVNLAVHICTAWFLFLTIYQLLHIYYNTQVEYPPHFFTTAALLSTLFWALAPIQTQAVTYIVQRMAAMATMFSIIGIYAYLRGKTAAQGKKYFWFSLCLVSFLAAMGSKENSALMPASIFLIEASFFRHQISKKNIVLFFIVTAIVIVGFGFFFIRHGLDVFSFHASKLFNFLEGYNERFFTLNERLLTEPRIIVMYLSQILFPNVQRLSIDHDIVLSTSLFYPWTTLPAILSISLMVFSSLFFFKKYPLFCFPVLFFFLNHIVESTVVPLELVFEHRNYLPSLFLFLPFGILVAHIIYSYPLQSIFRRVTAISCTILFVVIFGHATYTRNQAWRTVESLWSDALRKDPNSSRAAHYLGRSSIQSGNYTQASYFFKLALKNAKKPDSPKTSKTLALNGSGIAASLLGKNRQAIQYYNECLAIEAKDESCLHNRALIYLQINQPKKSLNDAIKLIQYYPSSFDYKYLAASSAYLADDYEAAMTWMQEIASQSLGNYKYAYLIGLVLLKNQAYQNSLFFLKRDQALSPNTLNYLLVLAGAYYGNNQFPLGRKILQGAIDKYPLSEITKEFKKISKNIDNNTAKELKNAIFDLSKKYSFDVEK